MRTALKRNYSRMARLSLILVYLVGAVVRMTGSGMGCPDWPKCFGYLIPPTEESELLWTPGKTYKSGQVIIREDQLLLAREDFKAADRFDPDRWEPYTRHDYAAFNATHTWRGDLREERPYEAAPTARPATARRCSAPTRRWQRCRRRGCW